MKGNLGAQGLKGSVGSQGLPGAIGAIGTQGLLGATGEIVTIGKLDGTAKKTYILGHTDSSSAAVSFAQNEWYRNIGAYILSGRCIYAQSFYETSDASKKNVIADVVINFDRLKEIPKKYFTFKDDDSNNIQIGTLAQDLQKVYPELVTEDDGIMHVAYDKLSIIALAAIDKQEEEISELRRKIKIIMEKLGIPD